MVRIRRCRIEHEMGELVGDHDADPRIVDGIRRDEREERPDGRDGLATDVLPGPGPQGVIERVLVGVDEEVDRFDPR